MRTGCGLFFLLIAAVCGWAAFNWGHNASQATGPVSWITNEKKTSENFAVRYGVGAAIFGILAIVILASGGSTPPQQHSQPQYAQPRQAPPPPSGSSQGSVEARLLKLRDLLDKKLITEAEYQRRRQIILEDV